MAALVVEDPPHTGVDQRRPLVPPHREVEGPAVREDHRQRRVLGAVDLRVQLHAVAGDHPADLATPARPAQGLHGELILVARPQGLHADRGGRAHRTRPERHGARVPAQEAHRVCPDPHALFLPGTHRPAVPGRGSPCASTTAADVPVRMPAFRVELLDGP